MFTVAGVVTVEGCEFMNSRFNLRLFLLSPRFALSGLPSISRTGLFQRPQGQARWITTDICETSPTQSRHVSWAVLTLGGRYDALCGRGSCKEGWFWRASGVTWRAPRLTWEDREKPKPLPTVHTSGTATHSTPTPLSPPTLAAGGACHYNVIHGDRGDTSQTGP